ncbi:hypothetical protein AAZX31_19G156700 [Glycine max]
MKTDDLPESSLLTALNGARFVYFDRRLHETALVVAHEEVKENIPILMDAGRLREGLDDLVKLADYVVCAARFLQRILPLKKWMLTNYWNPCKRERTEAHTSQPAYHHQ